MIITDYLYSTPSVQWEYAKQCGVDYAVIRLPETPDFDFSDYSHWANLCNRFEKYGLHPLVVEPLPNAIHDHIKAGDEQRDACIEKVIRMFPHMAKLGIHTLCFNFMAYVGWTRTRCDTPERGGALVTSFDTREYCSPNESIITQEELWNHYTYFIKAIVPAAEKWGIRMALHPDDPPLVKLGNVERILISGENILRALQIANSQNVGLTMCQATFAMMGVDLEQFIPSVADKIFFIHFRNVRGNKTCFQETFHDNGQLDMAALMRLYQKCNIDVPIRIDHVPTMAEETNANPGYNTLGRLFALGYLKGLLEQTGSSVKTKGSA